MSGTRAPECDRALSSLSSPFSYCCSVERGGLPEVLGALIHTGTRCVRGPLIENLLDPPADPKRPIKQTAAETRPPQRCGVNTADTSTQPSVLDRLIYWHSGHFSLLVDFQDCINYICNIFMKLIEKSIGMCCWTYVDIFHEWECIFFVSYFSVFESLCRCLWHFKCKYINKCRFN